VQPIVIKAIKVKKALRIEERLSGKKLFRAAIKSIAKEVGVERKIVKFS
jgi:hypothetical protein